MEVELMRGCLPRVCRFLLMNLYRE